MSDYVSSNSGVKVWKTPEYHPLLKHTDATHPAFRDKLAGTYSRGNVKGLPRICSVNSEDARTWHYFSPLLCEESRRTLIISNLLSESFSEAVLSEVSNAVPSVELQFWPKIPPPPSRPQKEGRSEPDVLIKLGQRAVVLMEAKCQSNVSERTANDGERDLVIRLIYVGSWYARQGGYDYSYIIVLQYGDAQTNAEEMVGRYAGNPEAIQRALYYRSDLKETDYQQLSRSVAFVRWYDPLNCSRRQ